jgi:transposase
MNDKDLYAKILGIEAPWRVVEVDLNMGGQSVTIRLAADEKASMSCPECGQARPGYDSRERKWRHLDTCQYTTILVAAVPRIECREHGVLQVKVPWAEEGSRFTAMFEALAIHWLKEASLSGVARLLGLSWDELIGIQRRAVERGLARRGPFAPRHIGVDETAVSRGQDYITVVSDQDTDAVLHVSEGRKRGALDEFYGQLSEGALEGIESVAMDMWQPYIASTRDNVPNAEKKIAYDKFHVAKHLGDAVDRVRREEQRRLRAEGNDLLTGTKYLWLSNPDNMTSDARQRFRAIKNLNLKTAKAWGYRRWAMDLWDYTSRVWAERAWCNWYRSAIHTKLDPLKKEARIIRRHLDGIVNAVVLGVTNARAEGINAGIQKIKKRACGYRNRENFLNAVYFHFGNLALLPSGVGPITHTKS